ncbi:MAG: EamA family transporter [Candidatus Omnitrophota bacterium]|nr:EamA family transporter [Candidatus Omnitrophota bacterium]MDZ4241832.1 EamA family transporter [Candidatus Omnitrophota bacterium]
MSWFLWSVLTALVWGCVPPLEKVGLSKIDPLTGLFFRCVGVLIGIVMLYVWKSRDIRASLANPPPGIAFLVLGGFLASVVGQVFFYHALKSGEASKVVPLAAAYPLISFILGVLFLGEEITLLKTGGLFCILAGVVLLK